MGCENRSPWRSSSEYPLLKHFPYFLPLAKADGLAALSLASTALQISTCRYKVDKVQHLLIGLWERDCPIGYFDTQSIDGTPTYKQVKLAYCRDVLSWRFAQLKDYLRRNPNEAAFACYIDPLKRLEHPYLGQTTHAIMLVLLQSYGWDKYKVSGDSTTHPIYYDTDHKRHLSGFRIPLRLRNIGHPLPYSAYSFYGRYGTQLGFNTYSTALSSFQVSLLEQACRQDI